MMYYSWTYEMITSCMYVPTTRQPLWQRHTAGGSHAIEKGVFEDTGSMTRKISTPAHNYTGTVNKFTAVAL